MKRPTSFDELTEAFEKLGVDEPEGWAGSETREGINQLGRALVLKTIWRSIVDERDTDWLNKILATDSSAEPFGMEASAKRIIDAGADPADLLMVVREWQFRLAFDICYALNGDAQAEDDFGVSWTLVETDLNGNARAPIEGLHESLLTTDPSGLEMEPLRAKRVGETDA